MCSGGRPGWGGGGPSCGGCWFPAAAAAAAALAAPRAPRPPLEPRPPPPRFLLAPEEPPTPPIPWSQPYKWKSRILTPITWVAYLGWPPGRRPASCRCRRHCRPRTSFRRVTVVAFPALRCAAHRFPFRGLAVRHCTSRGAETCPPAKQKRCLCRRAKNLKNECFFGE